MSASTRKRGWTVVLIPPQPTGRTRSLRVRPALMTVGGIVGAVALMALGSWTALQSTRMMDSSSQLEDARAAIAQLSDSLRRIHAAADAAMQHENDAAEPAPSAKPSTDSAAAKPHASFEARRKTGRVSIVRPVRATKGLGAMAPEEGVVLPVLGRITSRFARSRFHPLLRIFRPHYGVDVAAAAGTPIVVPAAGRVREVGRHLGSGLVVEIDHGNGVVTRYLHCRSALVREGETVAEGSIIATVGSSGLATGPHLHFEVLVNDQPVDPLRYHFSRPTLRAEAPPAVGAPIPHAPTTAPAAPAVPATTVAGTSGTTGGR